MADYYTKFSFTVPIQVPGNDEQEDERNVSAVVAELNQLIDEALEDPEHEAFPEEDTPMYGLDIAASGSEVWITDDAGEGSVDAAIAATQWLLNLPGAPEVVEFQWSNDCSKHRTDAFGGGIARVTAKSVETWGSWQGIPPTGTPSVQQAPDRTVVDAQGVRFEPWTDRWAIGFRCVHPDGRVEFVYLNPSSDSDDDVSNVFVYADSIGDPGSGETVTFVDLFTDNEGATDEPA